MVGVKGVVEVKACWLSRGSGGLGGGSGSRGGWGSRVDEGLRGGRG